MNNRAVFPDVSSLTSGLAGRPHARDVATLSFAEVEDDLCRPMKKADLRPDLRKTTRSDGNARFARLFLGIPFERHGDHSSRPLGVQRDCAPSLPAVVRGPKQILPPLAWQNLRCGSLPVTGMNPRESRLAVFLLHLECERRAVLHVARGRCQSDGVV